MCKLENKIHREGEEAKASRNYLLSTDLEFYEVNERLETPIKTALAQRGGGANFPKNW